MTTGCFREAKFHWTLSGNEFEERTVSSRPIRAGQPCEPSVPCRLFADIGVDASVRLALVKSSHLTGHARRG